MDNYEQHPLIQKFLDHQRTFGMPPHDYAQIKNMGTWHHPVTGEKHIVARDHGYSSTVMEAYHDARQIEIKKNIEKYERKRQRIINKW